MHSLRILLIVCFLSVLVASSHSTAQEPSAVSSHERAVLFLDRDPHWSLVRKVSIWRDRKGKLQNRDIYSQSTGMLFHELYRQAVLIAARDELGLTTRDATLGDLPPENENGSQLIVTTTFKNPLNTISLEYGPQDKREVLWSITFQPMGPRVNYGDVMRDCEALSRAEFLQSLQKALAISEKPPAAEPTAPPAESIAAQQTLLDDFTFAPQFTAVRTAHRLIQDHGESPQLLGQLVRGYAHLGILTALYHHPMHAVFEARSLLYAQRLVAKCPKSAQALRYRAYAFTLSGFDKNALQDLKEAKKLTDDDVDAELPTEWAEWLEAFCRYDLDTLQKAATEDDGSRLATLLWFIATDRAGSKNLTAHAGIAAVERMPECYRLYTDLCRSAGISVGHIATTAPLEVIANKLYPRLEAMSDLPTSVRAVIVPAGRKGLLGGLFGAQTSNESAEYAQRVRTIEALKVAGRAEKPKADSDSKPASQEKAQPSFEPDRGEVSWTVLGRMIEEETLNLACNRALFMSRRWGVNPNDFIASMRPLVKTHRYHGLVETFSWNKRASAAGAKAFMEALDWSTLEECDMYIPPIIRSYGGLYSLRYANTVIPSLDERTSSLVGFILRRTNPEAEATIADYLIKISPYSPLARAMLVDRGISAKDSTIKKWEKQASQHPVLLAAIANWHLKKGRLENALRCLKASVELDHDYNNCLKLADLYLQQDQENLWLETLEGLLKEPDLGLDHARVRVKISQHYRGKRNWKKAEPYAEAAAESYAGWALIEAALVKEGMQDWNAANALHRALVGRYGIQHAWDWYLFCRRTGQGELEVARQLVQPQVQLFDERKHMDYALRAGVYHLLESEPEQAVKAFEADYKKAKGGGINGPLWALSYSLLKQNDQIEKVLRSLHQEIKLAEGVPTPPFIALTKFMLEDLDAAREKNQKAGFAQFDQEKLEAVYQETWPEFKAWYDYLVGSYCASQGNHEKAIYHWKRAAANHDFSAVSNHARTLAGAALWEHGIAPAQYKAALHGEEEEKPADTKDKNE